MKTRYVNMSVETQEYLLKFLQLFPEIESWRTEIVSVGYTPAYGVGSLEKILNLKWSLGKKFRALSLVEKFGEEKAIEEWDNLFKIGNEIDFENKLSWLDRISATQVEVSATDFARGVKALYKKLTTITPVKVPGQKIPWRIPTLIIRLSGTRGQRHSFALFIYDEREERFTQLGVRK